MSPPTDIILVCLRSYETLDNNLLTFFLLQMNLLLRTALLSMFCILSSVESHRHISNTTNNRHFSNQLQSQLKRSTVARETYLTGSSILYGLLKQLNESYVTDTCNEHLQQVYKGINRKDVWAMKGNNNRQC